MIKLSRTGIEEYITCKRCFILKSKYKISLRSLPFTLNNAVDNLCKSEFDHYREKQEPHPLFVENDIDAVPLKHPDIKKWKDFKKGGIFYKNEVYGYHFWGAVDDVWVKANGELIVADVKATSKTKFDWEETWNKYDFPKKYKRQLEMYQWLFRRNGFQVSNTAYLVYYNGLKNEPMFNQTLKFESYVVKLQCNDDWVEKTLMEAKILWASDQIPDSSLTCETCQYLNKRRNACNGIE